MPNKLHSVNVSHYYYYEMTESHQWYEDQDALWTKVNSSREKVNSKVLSQSTWQE